LQWHAERNTTGKNSNAKSEEGIAAYLTDQTFTEKVFNYEENKEWNN
jgi:hypothetical protein